MPKLKERPVLVMQDTCGNVSIELNRIAVLPGSMFVDFINVFLISNRRRGCSQLAHLRIFTGVCLKSAKFCHYYYYNLLKNFLEGTPTHLLFIDFFGKIHVENVKAGQLHLKESPDLLKGEV